MWGKVNGIPEDWSPSSGSTGCHGTAVLCDRDTGDPPKVLQCSQTGAWPWESSRHSPHGYLLSDATQHWGISNRCSHLNRPNYLPLLSLKYISKLQLCLPSHFPSVLMPQSAPGMPQMNEFQVSHRLMCHQPELLDTLRKNDSNQEWRSGRHPKVTDWDFMARQLHFHTVHTVICPKSNSLTEKNLRKKKRHFRFLLKDKTHKEQYNKSSFNRFIKFIYTKQ